MLPKITIITPTLNQAQFIKETIRSVLSQNYPNLEYLVIDGGSSDGTQKILEQYNDCLTWISERDEGQVHAINKGLLRATGEIVAYLNSDDLYTPNSLLSVGNFFHSSPEVQILTGKCLNVDIKGSNIRSIITKYKNIWLRIGNDNNLKILNYISQPATFWRKTLIDSVGYFNPDYRNAMDYDYWLRVSQSHKIYFLNQYLAKFRIHPTSITSSNSRKQFDEEYMVAAEYSNKFNQALHKIHSKLSYLIYRVLLNRKPGG